LYHDELSAKGLPGTIMPTKRDIIEQLKREELQAIAESYELEVGDKRVREELIDAIVKSKRARAVDVLRPLSRDRLKEICIGLELDQSGREKSLLIERIIGETSSSEPADRTEESRSAAELLRVLLADSFEAEGSDSGWPSSGILRVGDLEFSVRIYARIVTGSARNNPLERRFQNPSPSSVISDDPDSHELLFGLWTEQGDERATLVAFDAYRRAEKNTRFSMFMPLSLLEQAADTGFATHENNKGEMLYAFRPENIGRYIQARVEDGSWKLTGLRQGRKERAGKPKRDAINTESLSPTTTDSLYIRPRVGMYAAFARLNYKPWFALAEFVDNSIQSFLHQRSRLRSHGHDGPLVIDVNLDDNEISVTDRAGGIAWQDFPRAFSPAAPPDDPSGLSEFGLGMKAAACWFSRRWTVRTSALGEALERTVAFDIGKISREGLENLPIESRTARDSDHFTVVTMHDLRVHPRGRTLAKIRDHLSSIYRVLLADEVVRIRLTYSGRTEELAYQQPDLLVAPYYRNRSWPAVLWRKEFAVDFHDKRVTGWAGVLKSGSHALAGFSVFRRRRLIEGSIGETYKPSLIFGSPNSFASQRIVGELFVEGFDVTHTKDGIQWHGYEDEVLESIRRQIDSPELPLLDQANGFRARKDSSSLPASFGAATLAGTAVAISESLTDDMLSPAPHPTAEEPEKAVPTAPVFQQKTFRLRTGTFSQPWVIHLELVNDPAAPFYTTSVEKRDDEDIISVRLNIDHEFSVAYLNDNESALAPVFRLVAALALAEKTARDSGVKYASTIRSKANEILRLLVAEPHVDGGEQ
jgi:hypothetical protein